MGLGLGVDGLNPQTEICGENLLSVNETVILINSEFHLNVSPCILKELGAVRNFLHFIKP
jgi:hypothetical protein